MTEKEATDELTSQSIKHILPEDSGPRKHHMFDNPDKARRMIEKSMRKFRNESKVIQNKIDFELLESIRQKYQKKSIKLPKLAPETTAFRSKSTMPRKSVRTTERDVSVSTINKSSDKLSHLSSDKLSRLDTLISDYSTSRHVVKSLNFEKDSRKRFADLKEKVEWATEDEISQFREIDLYYRYKRHEKVCNRANFMAPPITNRFRMENLDMSEYIQNRIGRNKLWRPSGENFPKRYELQMIQVDRQLERLSKHG